MFPNLDSLTKLVLEITDAPSVADLLGERVVRRANGLAMYFGEVRLEPLVCTGELLLCVWSAPEDKAVVAGPHVHLSSFETAGVLAGEVEFTLGGQALSLGTGDTVTVCPAEEHLIRFSPGSRGWVIFTPPEIGFIATEEDGTCRLRAHHRCMSSSCPLKKELRSK